MRILDRLGQHNAADDPQVLAAHLDFIKRLGARYDGHADIDHVDLGTVGWWGEWHMSQSSNAPMPTPDTRKKIVDAYLAAFQKTPPVMLIGGGEMLKYAVANGAGWRADCLGDMGGFSKTWCHMRMAYPTMLPEADAVDTWKTSPVAWETCRDMSGGAAVMYQNRLIQSSRNAKATAPNSAKTLADFGCRKSRTFRRMVARGVFIETDDVR